MKNGDLSRKSVTAGIGRLISCHPGKIVVLFLAITVLMALPLKNINTSTRISDYLPGCEYLDTDNKLRERFNASKSVVSILKADSGNIMTRQGLIVLREIEQAILASEEVSEYLISYDRAVETMGGVLERAIVKKSRRRYTLDNLPEKYMKGAITKVLALESSSSLVSKGQSDQRDSAVIVVHFNHNKIERDNEDAELALLKVMQDKVPDGYSLTALAAKNYHLEQDAKEGIRTTLPISLTLLLLVLMITLRNLIDFVASVVGLAVTMIISFGAFCLLGLRFSQMTFFAPIVIMVLAIDYAIHLLLRCREYRRKGLEVSQAMSQGIKFTGVSVLFSALTTMFGFGSNALSKIPAVASFGLFLALGIGVSFLVMTFFVPSLRLFCSYLAALLAGKRSRGQSSSISIANKSGLEADNREPPSHGWVKFVLYPLFLGIMGVALVLSGKGLLLARHIKRDMSAEQIYAKNSPVLQTLRTLNEKFPGIGLHRAYVLIEAEICEPEVLAAVDKSIANMADDEHVAKIGEAAKVRSIIPYLKEIVKPDKKRRPRGRRVRIKVRDANGDRLPDTKEGLAKVLDELYTNGIDKLVSAGSVKSLLSRNGANRAYDMMLLIVDTRGTQGSGAGQLLTELRNSLEPLRAIDGVRVSYAGFVFERHAMITEMTSGMIKSTFVSILLCTVIVILLFRSLRLGLIAAIPIILIAGWILGIMYVLGFTLNVITATVTAMSVGVGIDYSIHLVERYRQERETGKAIGKAMSKCIRTTGPSLLGAGITTFSGFFVMSYSQINMIRSFGILASLVIVLALVGSLIALPVMLMSSEKAAEWLKRK